MDWYDLSLNSIDFGKFSLILNGNQRSAAGMGWVPVRDDNSTVTGSTSINYMIFVAPELEMVRWMVAAIQWERVMKQTNHDYTCKWGMK